MSTSHRLQTHTVNTCVTCRARKVRCDGRRGICSNCERLGFVCSFDVTVGVASLAAAESDNNSAVSDSIKVPKRRVRQACSSCHAKKARCSGALPKCDRCRNHGLECVYRPGKRALAYPSSATSSQNRTAAGDAEVAIQDAVAVAREQISPMNHASNTDGDERRAAVSGLLSPSKDTDSLCLKALENFFRHVHHIPMLSFLHRASVMERFHAGCLDRALLLAMIGITSLLTWLGSGELGYGNQCIEESLRLCMVQAEKPSICVLQALIIIVKHRLLSRRFPGAFMLHALASRFATAMRLNHENPNLGFLAQEARRRVMWSLYMLDSSIAGGQTDVAIWPDAERQIQIRLPCNERNFEFDLPDTTEPLHPPEPAPNGIVAPLPDHVGFLALHIRVNWIRTRILQYAFRIASRPTTTELSKLPLVCARLVVELEAFAARLPQSFRWSESNVRLRTYSPRLYVFIMTHIWWQLCHLDLYRLFLPGLKEALSPAALGQLDGELVKLYQKKCYQHARIMVDMFAQLLKLDNGVPVTDLDLPACALQCSRTLYHGLQIAGEELGFTNESVRELATVCLRVAVKSTPGPACAAIQSDINKLISDGLLLVPALNPGPPTSSASTQVPRPSSQSRNVALPQFMGKGNQQTPAGVTSYLGTPPWSDPIAQQTAETTLRSGNHAPARVLSCPPYVEEPVGAAVASQAAMMLLGSNAFDGELCDFGPAQNSLLDINSFSTFLDQG